MSRTACVCAGGCLLLLLTVAGAETYDDVPTAENMDDLLMYQADNEIDAGPAMMGEQRTFSDLSDRSTDLLLERLIQEKLANNHNYYGSTWDAPNPRLLQMPLHKRMPGFFNLKLKAKTPVLDGKRTSRPKDRPQPKWKIKKGRVSSSVVCYFKLCAFRANN